MASPAASGLEFLESPRRGAASDLRTARYPVVHDQRLAAEIHLASRTRYAQPGHHGLRQTWVLPPASGELPT